MMNSSDHNPVDHAGVRIPPPLFYVGIFIVGLLLQQVYPVTLLPTDVQRSLALLGVGGWAITGGWSLLLFWRRRTHVLPDRPSTTLVIAGPYRFTRNPMYVSLTSLYTGLALWFNVLWALPLLPLVLLIIRYYVIDREERYLERRFGEEYIQYKARVRRWL